MKTGKPKKPAAKTPAVKQPMAVEWWPIGKPAPYARNARKISKRAVDKLAASIQEFGWRQPIVVDSKAVIVAGHTRLMAAQKLDMKKVPVHVASDLTEAQIKAYRLMDNRSHDESEWDMELVEPELLDLKALEYDLAFTGFEQVQIQKLLAVEDPEEDNAPPPPVVPVTVTGDLWLLGGHRVLCGDSTSIDAVERLMDGKKADMVFTDPPYGVNYTGGAKKRESLANDHAGTDIYGDALPLLAVVAADHAALYLWYADAHAAAAAAAAAAAGYVITAQVIWVKNNAQFMSSAHYHGKHEPCFFAHRKGRSAAWYGPNNEVTVWEVDRAQKNEYHPTQKPIALAERAIANSSKDGDTILDMFGGSGSTLIAAQKTGRLATLMEISPAYVDVIVTRWQQFTGLDAVLDDDGRTFDAIKASRIGKNKAA